MRLYNHHINSGYAPIVIPHHDQTLYITPTSAQEIRAHRSNYVANPATVTEEIYNQNMRELHELFSKGEWNYFVTDSGIILCLVPKPAHQTPYSILVKIQD